MSMHIEGPWLSTTGKKKGKQKFASAFAKQQAAQLDKDWKEIQARWNITADQKKRTAALAASTLTTNTLSYRGDDQARIPSLNSGLGNTALAPAKVYTGSEMLGIGQLHKSNAVPVFRQEDALDIARMRR